MNGTVLDTSDAERLLRLGRSLTSIFDLESLLSEIASAARDLTGAEYAALGVLNADRNGLERFVTVGIDDEGRAEIGALPSGRGVLKVLIDEPRPLRLEHLAEHPDASGFPAHHPPMDSFLGVPIMIGETAFGNLYLTNKAGGAFDDRDELAVVTLAAWAAIAIQNARSVHDDRLRAAIEGSENERKRWARELHDDTLQSLGALHLLFSSALRRGDLGSLERAAREGGDQLRLEISNLRSLITELRPAALDEIGLEPALRSLGRRMTGLSDVEFSLDAEPETFDGLPDYLQLTVYRIVQEAANNAAKHSTATRVSVSFVRSADFLTLTIQDDGGGFDTGAPADGFGIVGMRERAALLGGSFEIASTSESGTQVSVTLPLNRDD